MSARTRNAAVVVWTGAIATPLFFAAVTVAVAPPAQLRSPELSGLFFWMAAAMVGLGVALSRTLPPRLAARSAASPDGVAFVRLAAALGILEGAAMFPLVAHLVTGDPFLFLLTAVALAAFVPLFPSPERWAAAGVRPLQSGGANRLVR